MSPIWESARPNWTRNWESANWDATLDTTLGVSVYVTL